jgi:NAD(P)-dependent dehydrogenase (short-subunit alcohol dehydrogenase family)
MEEEGGRGLACPGDVTDLSAMKGAFEKTRRELGPVRIVISNAGVHVLSHYP